MCWNFIIALTYAFVVSAVAYKEMNAMHKRLDELESKEKLK